MSLTRSWVRGLAGFGVLGLLAPAAAWAGTYTVIHEFIGTDGQYPQSELVEGPDGALYGTTPSGGASDDGVVFRIGETGYELLSSFSGTNGATPDSALTLADGELYGTTLYGGPRQRDCRQECGTAYRLGADGGIETIANFNTEVGTAPYDLTLGADGAFYGIAREGGEENFGSLFRLTSDGSLEAIHYFSGGDNGYGPLDALLLGSDGALYGTTQFGGLYDQGIVYRIRDGVFERLHSFSGSLGANPNSRLIEVSGEQIVGTTYSGGVGGDSGWGVVYRLSATKGYKVLHYFDCDTGCYPEAAPVLGADGWMYGTTTQGGVNGGGVLYRVKMNGKYQVLHDFGAIGDGRTPLAPLMFGADGSLYGSASQGGVEGYYGLLFRYEN